MKRLITTAALIVVLFYTTAFAVSFGWTLGHITANITAAYLYL